MESPVSMGEQVIAANVEFYEQIASRYDEYESCTSDATYQQMLERDLDAMHGRLPPGGIHCLDCGGGSGNLTLKMLNRGWTVKVVDLSPEMLEVSRAKVRRRGYTAEFLNDSIEHYLAANPGTFDVITFSSVLHHLYSPLDVIRGIGRRVNPGGFFYSNFDPVLPSSRLLARCFYDVDTVLAKLARDRRDILPGIARRLKKVFMVKDAQYGRAVGSAGDLAEYHARTGLDDLTIERTLSAMGFEVRRRRYPVARTALTKWANERIKAFQNFSILAQRKSAST